MSPARSSPPTAGAPRSSPTLLAGVLLGPCLYDAASQRHAIEPVLQEVMRSVVWRQALENPGHDPSYQGLIGAWLRQFVAVAPTLKHATFHEVLCPLIVYTDVDVSSCKAIAPTVGQPTEHV